MLRTVDLNELGGQRTEILEANFHIEFLTMFKFLLQGVLKYFDYRKTREALAVSNQELSRTRAELTSCKMSTRWIIGIGLFVLLLVLIAAE
jgi:hypothetical protein